MSNNKGFTLLEVLVIIIVLAIVIALLFSYFGNPVANVSVHSATSQIADNFRAIDEAWNSYYIETAKEVYDIDILFRQGYLKSIPEPPVVAKDEKYNQSYSYAINYTDFNFAGSESPDIVLTLRGLSEPVCRKINQIYAGISEKGDIPSSFVPGKSIQCINNGDHFVVMKIIYVK